MTQWLQLQQGFEVPTEGYSKRLWMTFENRRPVSGYFQRTLSFDLDDFSGSNLYLPLWALYIDFLENGANWVRHQIRQEDLFESRVLPDHFQEKKFLCAFINNPEPTRIRALLELSKIGTVDIFGRYSGNYVKDKIEVSKNYRFSMCFENDLYPGYVTEKPLEAWLGETIPLYWGDDSGGYLNPNCLINLKTFSNLNEFINYVAFINSSSELYARTYVEPFLRKKFDKEELISFVSQWIGE